MTKCTIACLRVFSTPRCLSKFRTRTPSMKSCFHHHTWSKKYGRSLTSTSVTSLVCPFLTCLNWKPKIRAAPSIRAFKSSSTRKSRKNSRRTSLRETQDQTGWSLKATFKTRWIDVGRNVWVSTLSWGGYNSKWPSWKSQVTRSQRIFWACWDNQAKHQRSSISSKALMNYWRCATSNT